MTAAIPFELDLSRSPLRVSSSFSAPLLHPGCLATSNPNPPTSALRSLRALFLSWRFFAASFCLFSTLSTLFFEKWGVFFPLMSLFAASSCLFSTLSKLFLENEGRSAFFSWQMPLLHLRLLCFQQVLSTLQKSERITCPHLALNLS